MSLELVNAIKEAHSVPNGSGAYPRVIPVFMREDTGGHLQYAEAEVANQVGVFVILRFDDGMVWAVNEKFIRVLSSAPPKPEKGK